MGCEISLDQIPLLWATEVILKWWRELTSSFRNQLIETCSCVGRIKAENGYWRFFPIRFNKRPIATTTHPLRSITITQCQLSATDAFLPFMNFISHTKSFGNRWLYFDHFRFMCGHNSSNNSQFLYQNSSPTNNMCRWSFNYGPLLVQHGSGQFVGTEQ